MPAKKEPKLLSGGNPQIPKGDGDGPVQDFIAAMPGWKHDVGRALDDLIGEEVPDVRPGMPWTVIAKGASDPTGAVRDLERILTGLRWRQVLPPLVVTGDATDADLESARELGATLAAGIGASIW